MDVSYINPFIEASSNVIKQSTGLNTKLGKIFLKTSPYKCSGVVMIVGITGKIKGQAVFSMEKSTALSVVSAMMMGTKTITELDEMSRSALGELANMILGNTASIFYKKGIILDITPPSVLTGDDLEISRVKQDIVCVPIVFGTKDKHIDLDIAFAESWFIKGYESCITFSCSLTRLLKIAVNSLFELSSWIIVEPYSKFCECLSFRFNFNFSGSIEFFK